MEMRIVVATDGSEAASGALHIACALAQRHGAAVEVVSVLEPFPIHAMAYGETVGLAKQELDDAARTARRHHVETQLTAAGGDIATWPVTCELGPPAPSIVRFTREKGATLIVLGLGRHALADRWFGSETALRVMRIAHVPVLAVAAEERALPDQAVAAVDFSEFSRDAAESVLQIIRPGGTLHLVYVLWKPSGETAWVEGRDWPEVQRQRLRGQLDELARRLEGVHGIRVEPRFLEGDAAGETLRFAGTVGAGLIAAGSHGAGFFGRLLMGSVSTRLVRGATRMVLIAPPRTVPAELEAELQTAEQVGPLERLVAGAEISGRPNPGGT
jgi:nucleotide-binding universal stress UspA family protein